MLSTLGILKSISGTGVCVWRKWNINLLICFFHLWDVHLQFLEVNNLSEMSSKHGSRGGDGVQTPPPLKNHKNNGFLKGFAQA